MSKREARSFAAAGVDVDAPRAKRRKEAPATSSASPERKHDAEAHTAPGDAKGDSQDAESVVEDKEEVREKGIQLWQTLKDAVNKECVVVELHLAFDPNVQSFLPLTPPLRPHRPQCPSTYHQRPNCLLPVHASSLKTTIPRLLRPDQAAYSSR